MCSSPCMACWLAQAPWGSRAKQITILQLREKCVTPECLLLLSPLYSAPNLPCPTHSRKGWAVPWGSGECGAESSTLQTNQGGKQERVQTKPIFLKDACLVFPFFSFAVLGSGARVTFPTFWLQERNPCCSGSGQGCACCARPAPLPFVLLPVDSGHFTSLLTMCLGHSDIEVTVAFP